MYKVYEKLTADDNEQSKSEHSSGKGKQQQTPKTNMKKTKQEPLAGPSRDTGVCRSDDESIDINENSYMRNVFTPT
ncbi:hypothetical protein DPMN_119734 [Dreissena polymorpha]|uniref:Uncharacterized protein n=1 Tax=Dreissena polymorpha TaxID=45954 RepID=A0A9D4GJQ4_DREPO|nr:hypothetical protein DPMN_119734 [Dreissena polymorpha]